MSNEFLWVEKYRPTAVSQTILPDELKTTFQNIVVGGELPNMMFTGSAGTGKTTVILRNMRGTGSRLYRNQRIRRRQH